MSNFLKKIFDTLIQKPWEKEQIEIDALHEGKTFNISAQKSAVIIIFGVATVLFSLVFTGYLYTLPPEQDTRYLLKPNLLWINTLILFFVTYYFNKITKDLEKKETSKIKKNLITVGVLSYLFLFGQIIFWFQLIKSGNIISKNSYFSSFYFFTALHGLHLLGGLFFWGRISSRVLKLDQSLILDEEKNISALSLYWTYLLIVWIMFFLMIYIFNDAVIAWCKTLIS
jgi:cytochrome c oxidase subunit 3